MAHHRFYLQAALQPSAELAFSASQAAQMARVLRLRAGDQVEVFDGAGASALVELRSLDARGSVGMVREVWTRPWPLRWRVTLCLALLRPQRFEWAIEKAVELGVWAIQPLQTVRTQHGGAETSAARRTRWQAIATEAAEQCGSVFVPAVRAPLRLDEALHLPAALRLLPHTAALLPRASIAEALADSSPEPAAEFAVYIGPEGGFAPDEVAAALQADSRVVTLGPLTLRSETAALAALALINAAG